MKRASRDERIATDWHAPLAYASALGKATGGMGAVMLSAQPMKRLLSAATLFVPIVAFPAASAQAETLDTMPHGTYECSYPGDAAGAAWDTVEDAGFRIARASSYRSPKGRGVYLLKADILTFTRGPMKGRQLKRTDENILRQIEADGTLGRMTCVRIAGSR